MNISMEKLKGKRMFFVMMTRKRIFNAIKPF